MNPYPRPGMPAQMQQRQGGLLGLSNNFWGDALNTIGTGLLGLGSGRDDWGLLAMQQMQARQQDRLHNTRQATQDAQQAQMFEFQKRDYEAKQAAAMREQQQEQAKLNQFEKLWPTLPPALQQTAQAMGPSFVDLYGKEQIQQQFADPASAPTVKDFFEGGNTVQKQWNPQTNSWDKVGEGPRWAPKSEGAGIEIDYDHDGVPDLVIGGSGMKPLSESASAGTVRGEFINQGLADIEAIDFDKVSPAKMAAAESLSGYGPFPAMGGEMMLNDNEKKLLGAQAKIQEAVISTITGAAYSEEQKKNVRAATVILPTDSAQRRAEKTLAAAKILRQLDKNTGGNRVSAQDTPAGATEFVRGPGGKIVKKVNP